MSVPLHDLIHELPNQELLAASGISWSTGKRKGAGVQAETEMSTRRHKSWQISSGSRTPRWTRVLPLLDCSALPSWIYEPNISSFIQVNVNLVSVTYNQFVLTAVELQFSSHWASHHLNVLTDK